MLRTRYLRTFRGRYPDVWPSDYKLGMWAWLLHRLTGLFLIGYGIFHLFEASLSLVGEDAFDWLYSLGYTAWMQSLDFVLVAALLYHSMNGLAIILVGLGIGVRKHKALFSGLMFAGFVLFVIVARDILPFIIGRHLY